ncbi:hypothetical protein SAMN04487977_102561 [Treponema bryantii]|uniref:Uncharacterized protein n=1 Tax=Treponema bryantii TaxID=163 RepID=A0A1H9DFW7_9SPIR|nr:hypothetical protein [Treponema bryantii]SEQ12366.1 hypothetical protein SAMN04487977_102561 [Treponema bryantii]
MKRKILFILLILFQIQLFSQEYHLRKLMELKNIKETENLYRRKTEDLEPYDDNTGNVLCIDNNGDIYIQCIDTKELLKIKNNKLKLIYNTNFLIYNVEEVITAVTDKSYIYTGLWGVFKGFDKEFNQIFNINIYKDNGIIIENRQSYYLEKANVLFFWDNKENIYCVVNPGMDKEENRKNFHNTEETKRMFKSDVEMNGVKIRVTNSNNIFINGNFHFWKQDELGNYRYQKVTNNYFLVYNKDNIEEKYRIKFPDDTEVIESSALHPSGDIYVLRMNWNTNTHNLYCIENTWDPQWRAQWYKEHSKN